MVTVVLQGIGVVAFLLGSVWLGRGVRRLEGQVPARRLSRISHLLFWLCLMLPGFVGLLSPGLRHYDGLLGVPPLPWGPVLAGVGSVIVVGGLGLMIGANRALARLGGGTAAFVLTKRVVSEGIYRRSRNPMSLGFYMACVGLGLLGGSTTVTIGALAIVVPVHMFSLRYFEERELARRFGQPYLDYRARTPFVFLRLKRRSGVGA
jgi:protein-S-isoprenylcysteine O-methyltransferase Ste14